MPSPAKKMGAIRFLDTDDAQSLLEHIEGHVEFAKEAIDRGNVSELLEQAEEIEGWARSIREICDAALVKNQGEKK